MVSDLTVLPLEDCLDALIDYRGKTPRKTDFGIPLITAKVVKAGRIETPDEFIAEEDYAKWMTRGYPKIGDIVLTTEAPLGEVAQIKFLPVSLAQRIVTLRGKKGVLDNGYLLYLLQSKEMQAKLVGRSSGTTVIGIKQSELRKVEVVLPPIEEQRTIAHILGALDDKIELNRRMNQTLEAMTRALFDSWFVDFDGIPPEDMQESELGLIPKEWRVVPVSELIEFNPTEPMRKGTLAPYLDMAALPTVGSWPDQPVLREFGSGMRFCNGDTLLARITPCLENGKTAFVQCLPKDACAWGSTEFIVMRPKDPIPAEYAYLLARDGKFREYAIRNMTGTSGRQRVQANSVAEFKVASPIDLNVWQQFEDFASPVFKSIKANAEASQTLTQLRDTLLPKLISGELRIKDIDRITETV